jgi:Flp pilus assembly secretin CpaC
MPLLKIVIILLFISVNAFSNEINLTIKKEKLIEFEKDVVEVIIGDENIVSVSENKDKDTLKIKGLKKGKTELDIHLRDGSRLTYKIFVGVSNISLKSALAKIGRMNDVRITKKNGLYLLNGNVLKRSNGILLKRIIQVHSNIFIDKTSKKYRNSSSSINVTNKVLEQNGFGYYQVRKYGKLIYLEGSKKNLLDHKKALKIARLLIPRIQDGVASSLGRAGAAVSIDVLVLSYSNDKTLELGLKGADNQTLATYQHGSVKDGSGYTDSYNWTLGPFTHVLKLVQTVSNTKVLANPRIVVRTGEEATFHSGKENFLKTETTNSSGAVLASYMNVPTGILLKVLPQVDKIGQIDVSIDIEDSTFSGTIAEPAKSKSKSSTKVTVQNGYSILLSGFKRQTKIKTINKIPLLGDIPLLGELFKNRTLTNNEENVMVLMTVKLAETPSEQSTLFSDAKEARIIPGEFSKLESDSTQGVEFSIWD